ncbi:MAG TPA: thioredoxin family protein [Candidatus Eisenbacteria bacterium]|nr:thioredoxin family protein [Candidatus Eisenbacteria bacterium]
MKAFVFTDKALSSQAGRFVWLALDSENGKNAAALAKYPVAALPTFLVIDPGAEKVAMRWVGGMNVTQLTSFLNDGAAASDAKGDVVLDGPLQRADRYYGEGNYAEAWPAYEQAIAAAPPSWPEYPRAVEALLFSLSMADDKSEESAKFVEGALPRLTGTPTELTAATYGLDAALQVPKDNPKRAQWVKSYEATVTRLISDPKLQVAVDDRSGAYGSLVDARKDAGDTLGAHQTAEKWAAMLEEAAKQATTPQERTVFDSHRLAAYRELGEPQRALPMLQQSERDFPDDYNPPYRLSIAYTDLKRYDDAVAASDRALAHVYGPRKIQVLRARADLMGAKGDHAGAVAAVEEAIRTQQALPAAQTSDATLKSLQKKLATLNAPADGSASKGETK